MREVVEVEEEEVVVVEDIMEGMEVMGVEVSGGHGSLYQIGAKL